MNDDHSQADELRSPNLTESKKKGGCAGCLIIILGLILFGYIILFQTSIPLKLITHSMLKDTRIDGRPLVIKGVGGSLSGGISIRELIIPGAAGDTTITNLKLKYKKPIRWFTRGQFTFTEISSSSAEFVVANDFFQDKEEEQIDETQEPEVTGEPQPLFSEEGFFDLHLLKFENTRIRTVDGSIDIKIPLIYIKDLHASREKFHIEDLKAQSNVLSVSLADGKTMMIDGRKVEFDQQINFSFKPDIHPSVIKEIPLSLSFKNHKGKTTVAISAFHGALQQGDFADTTSFLRLDSFSPEEYAVFDKHVMPSDFNIVAREKDDAVDLEAGSFTIGRTPFNFPAQQFDNTDDHAALLATATAGPYEVTAMISPDDSNNAWPPILVELSSQPEAPLKEILAQLYYSKDCDSLSDDEKARIDKLE